ncbi:MAG: hypothetical protein Q8M15_05765 [Bacteroidota bacterium]|nr:hypothetical protein [Bacteroidota bacterium]
MEINDIKSLRNKREQLKQAYKQTELQLNAQTHYFSENKFSVLWASLSPVSNLTKDKDGIWGLVQSTVLPALLGKKSVLLTALLPAAELLITKYAVKGIEKLVEKVKKKKETPVDETE